MFSLYDFVVTIKADSTQADAAIQSSGQQAGMLGGKFNGLKTAGAAAFAAIGVAAGAAAVKIGKSAFDAYANYEQLVGGVKKLYGNAANELMKNAQEAYKTSGMSANQYMEQATSFSAALIGSLNGDTKKAAEQTDVAMRAISDNVNTFGTDMGSVQYAFQGFAKQNYTMLDNLKLGYGGTKTEMKRLVDDANEYAKANGMAADLTMDSFSDIVTAIDLIQQKQNVAGTTAKEAASTISGSLGMVKSAWENLLINLANPDANIGELVKTLVSSLSTAAGNIFPVVGQIAQGIVEALSEIVPQAINMIVENLPNMISTGTQMIQSLIQGIVTAIPQISSAILNNMDAIISAGVELIIALANGLTQAIPKVLEALPKIINALLNALIDNLPKLIEAGVKLIIALVKGLVKAIPQLIKLAPKIVKALVVAIGSLVGQLVSAGVKLMTGLIRGIGNKIHDAVQKAKDAIVSIKDALVEKVKDFLEVGKAIIEGIWNGLKDKAQWLKDQIKSLVGSVKNFLKKLFGIKSPSKWAREEIGWNIAEGLALGIQDGQGDVQDAMNALMPDYSMDTFSVNGGLQGALQMSVNDAVTGALSELTPVLQQGMADAMDGIQVKLNSRNFGKFAREAVNGTI